MTEPQWHLFVIDYDVVLQQKAPGSHTRLTMADLWAEKRRQKAGAKRGRKLIKAAILTTDPAYELRVLIESDPIWTFGKHVGPIDKPTTSKEPYWVRGEKADRPSRLAIQWIGFER